MRRLPDNDLRPSFGKHSAIAPGITRRGATNGFVSDAWQTPQEISELIQQRECAVALLPEGEVTRSIRTEIAQLRRREEMARIRAAGASMTANDENSAGTISSTS